MAQYKIENKKLSIEILGKTIEVTKPKFKDVIALQEKMESMTSKDKFVYIEESLIKYGIPKETLDELDAEAFIELLEIIHGTKKN